MKQKIVITINGKEIYTNSETTIYQAAQDAGIIIPHLCYHPSMPAIGSCRLCLVELEGHPALPPACSTLVTDGMVIWTETERVNNARRIILEQLLGGSPPVEQNDYRRARFYTEEYSTEQSPLLVDTDSDRSKTVRTICPYCGVGCAIDLKVENGDVVNAKPADGPANRNLICVKGRFGWDFIRHPDRLKTPLIKTGGKFVEASWDEALNLVASKFLHLKEQYGVDSFAGLSSAKCTNEENYLFQKFTRAVMGTNNVDNSARLCHSSTITGLSRSFGSGAATNSIGELEEAEVILIIGSNTTEAHPVIGMRLQKNRHAKIILVDPRAVDLVKRAHLHLQLLPGTDVALLNGMMHVILAEGLEDRKFIRERTKNFAELKDHVEKYDPSCVSKMTGVPAEKIIEAAKLYAQSKRSTILYAMGVTQHIHGTDNVRSTANLAMLTGNVGRPSTGVYPLRGQNNVQGACDMGALPNYLPGYQRVVNEDVRKKFEDKWGCSLSKKVGYTVVEMTEAALDGRVKGMYIMGENPVLSNPDTFRVEKGLGKLDFLVVQDIFLTETAMFADVVLPGASFAEKEGTFSNTERRVQRIRKAIEPIGYSLADWRIICLLSGKCGMPFPYRSAEEVMQEIAEVTPIYGGVSYKALGDNGIQWPCPFPGHPGTEFLHHERFAGGLGYFTGIDLKPPPELPEKEYPFLLMTGRNLYHFHTGTMTRRSDGLKDFRPEPYVEINPRTAKSLGIGKGELVKIESKRGGIDVKAFFTNRVQLHQIYIPFHYAEGAANVLTHVSLDTEARIPELKISAVKLSKIGDSINENNVRENTLTHALLEIQEDKGSIGVDEINYLAKQFKRPVSEVYGKVYYNPLLSVEPASYKLIPPWFHADEQKKDTGIPKEWKNRQ